MSIDARARSAVVELRDTAQRLALPTPSDVTRASARRRRARITMLAATCVGIVGVGLMSGSRIGASPDVHPASTPTPTVSATFGLACQLPGVTCSDGRIRAAGLLALPVSFAPLPGMNTDDISPGGSTLELRRTTAGRTSGVTVFERPVAVDGSPDRVVRSLDGTDAAKAGVWLATRPFVRPTTPQVTEVGGLRAYRVDVSLRSGAVLPSFAHGSSAALTFITAGGFGTGTTAAVAPELRDTTYYLVDVPGHGLLVIWVWSVDGSAQDVAWMSSLVSTIRFG